LRFVSLRRRGRSLPLVVPTHHLTYRWPRVRVPVSSIRFVPSRPFFPLADWRSISHFLFFPVLPLPLLLLPAMRIDAPSVRPSVTQKRANKKAFAPFAPGPSSSSPTAKSLFTLPLQKLVYLVCNVLTLALGLWKCRSMGLLPTGTGDWLAFESRGSAPEISLF
jgi:hypothetical protein